MPMRLWPSVCSPPSISHCLRTYPACLPVDMYGVLFLKLFQSSASLQLFIKSTVAFQNQILIRIFCTQKSIAPSTFWELNIVHTMCDQKKNHIKGYHNFHLDCGSPLSPFLGYLRIHVPIKQEEPYSPRLEPSLGLAFPKWTPKHAWH